jgi:hypothetical protein
MKLYQRIAYYGMGLLVGSIFVYFVWGKKSASFDYMPNARVLKTLRADTQVFSNTALENMKIIGIDTADISAILRYGNVDFKKSTPREKPCKTYVIDGKPQEKNITIVVKKCEETTTIDKVTLN